MGRSNKKEKESMKPPKILDKIVDIVLAYKPKPKSEQAEKREQEREKVEKEDRKRK